jgi:hypothetical protein
MAEVSLEWIGETLIKLRDDVRALREETQAGFARCIRRSASYAT